VDTIGPDALLEVWDDKLGLIGQARSGDRLRRTTTLHETTTNYARVSSADSSDPWPCFFGDGEDSVTVTVMPLTQCAIDWPVSEVYTLAKGQSPQNNQQMSHVIQGHIIDPDSVKDTDHRIEVCAGTMVTSRVLDFTNSGGATITARGSLTCGQYKCSGIVTSTEKYESISGDGRDKDSITFIPR